MIDPKTRFEYYTEKAPNGCLMWTASCDPNGYGQLYVQGKTVKTHRWWYEQTVGPIPEGMTIDHECHNRDTRCEGLGKKCPHRRCVEPTHLLLRTHEENKQAARGKRYKKRAQPPKSRGNGEGRGSVNAVKTHCPKNHEYTEENTYWNPSGSRQCRQCTRDANARYAAKKKLALDQVN